MSRYRHSINKAIYDFSRKRRKEKVRMKTFTRAFAYANCVHMHDAFNKRPKNGIL